MASGSHFCSACGAKFGGPASSPATGSNSRAEALLAEANLLRMRSKWLDAEARCVDVMRLDPKNVDAQSLLGDIYRDQSKFEEAAQWYQLVLDAQPSRSGERLKLREAKRSLAKSSGQSVPDLGALGASKFIGTQKLIGLSPNNWFRVIWVVCALFFVTVVIIVVSLKNSKGSKATISSGTLPGSIESGPSTSGVPSTPKLPTNPANKGTLSSSLSTPRGPTDQQPLTGTPSIMQSSPANALSEREATLQSHLSRQSSLSANASIGSVTIDPREQKVTVVLTERIIPQTGNIDTLRDNVIRDAAHISAGVFEADQTFQRVTVNARVTDGSAAAESFFAGDMDRGSAQHVAESSSTAQILTLFSGVWWAYPPTQSPSPQPSQPTDAKQPGDTKPGTP
jgi:hypothetical protein